jgi:hypothetical protein
MKKVEKSELNPKLAEQKRKAEIKEIENEINVKNHQN